MPRSEYRPTKVRKKTREILEYHRDAEQPGKPLHLLIPGGTLAIASLVAIVGVIYQTWFRENLADEVGTGWLFVLVPIYITSVFLFSYGYELYEFDRALWLTGIIVFSTLAMVLVVAVIAMLLASAGNSNDGSSKSDSKKKSAGGNGNQSRSSSGSNLSYSARLPIASETAATIVSDVADIVVDTLVSTNSTSAPYVAPAGIDVAVMQTVCEYCGSKFDTELNQFTCPQCGAGDRATVDEK